LTKLPGPGWNSGAGWNAGAYSSMAIQAGDGYMEFSVADSTSLFMIGLSKGNTDTTYPDIDYAVYVDPGGVAYAFEAGEYKGASITYAPGDRFRVAVEGGTVRFRKNGAAFYEHAASVNYPLLVDSSLYFAGSVIQDVTIAGALSPSTP
jgi:hypothetical protein